MIDEDLTFFKANKFAKVTDEVKNFCSDLEKTYVSGKSLTKEQTQILVSLFCQYYTLETADFPTTFVGHNRQKFDCKTKIKETQFNIIKELHVELPFESKAQNQCYLELLKKYFTPLFGFYRINLLRYLKESRADIPFNRIRALLSTETNDILEYCTPRTFPSYVYPSLLLGNADRDHLKLAHWSYYCIHSIDHFSKTKLDYKENRFLKGRSKRSTQYWSYSQIKTILKKFNPKITDHEIKITIETCCKLGLFEEFKNNILGKVFKVKNAMRVIEDHVQFIEPETKIKVYGKCFSIRFDKKNWMPTYPNDLLFQLLTTDLDRADFTSFDTIRKFWGFAYGTISKRLKEFCIVKKTYSIIGTIKFDFKKINQLYQINKRLRPSKIKDGYCRLYQVEANRHKGLIPYSIRRQTFSAKFTQMIQKPWDELPRSIQLALLSLLPSEEIIEMEKCKLGYIGFEEKYRVSYNRAIAFRTTTSKSIPSANLNPKKVTSKGIFLKGCWKTNNLVKTYQAEYEVVNKTSGETFTTINTQHFIPAVLNRDDIYNQGEEFLEQRQIVQRRSLPTKSQISKTKLKESSKSKITTPCTPHDHPTKSFHHKVLRTVGSKTSNSLITINKGGSPNRSDHC